ncbi:MULTISPECIES: hypothetical protein [unclassified Pseudovibrio]|uniref:hypothetical protein n=1 Tax=unclassified Pseudovibrio TaxID=2627060 RepID=UPI0007AE6717|nr:MULTISPECIES: hypothetical protein [unclassified Pseudovibrio]KZL19690.1 hypothetical protein PsAD37_03679 [Pseudovibrio sp. Ad37]KZL26750.1 hypothetical protein PsWM33_01209 [Pseudovibrio sp. WM33]
MRSLLCIAINLAVLAITSTSALAIAERLNPHNKKVTFTNLSMANGNPDDGTCQQRYGASITTQSVPSSTNDILKRKTDKGHIIQVISIDDSVNTGILSVRNQYEIIFPNDKSKTPVRLKLLATGLVGSKEASGVFSDGTCRGNLHIQIIKEDAPQ